MKKSKKGIIFSLVLLAAITLFTACGSQQTATDSANAVSSNSSQTFSRNAPDLYGEVKTISGNDFTIALLEMPQRGQMGQGGRMRNGSGGNGGNGTGNNNGNSSGNNSGNNSNSSTNNNGTNNPPRQGGGFAITKKYTGKSETLTIPEGTAITTYGRGNGNRNGNGNGNAAQNQLKIGDIKVGSLIQVYYKKDTGDKKEIDSIRVIQTNAPASTPVPAPATAS